VCTVSYRTLVGTSLQRIQTIFASICDDTDCKLFARITCNTQHLLSTSALSLFVNAVTTFNFLIAHQFSKTNRKLCYRKDDRAMLAI